MRKGATATQVIIALALGLMVLVGLGYLLWTWIGRGGGEVSEQYCRAKAFTFCSKQATLGYPDIPDEKDTFLGKNPDCNVYDFGYLKFKTGALYRQKCEEILGT
ncbi:MAG: hypothetical protein ISS48_00025 [Candidatus Aenigmarchaeota archaeon]|nr:hypothetical protein [Candidatus Aenigmarchaeota archaeon]